MKWYVYTLSISRKVFYVGFTKNPIRRYKEHYHDPCSACYKLTRYWLSVNNTITTMDLVRSFNNKFDAMDYESSLITDYSKIFPLINLQYWPWIYTSCIPLVKTLRTCTYIKNELTRIKTQMNEGEKI